MNQEKEIIRTAGFSVLSNLLLSVIKGLAGWWGNSFALIADAIESFADVFSSLMVYVGLKYAVRPADANHPYGHGRMDTLLTFIVVGFLIASAILIAWQSIHRIVIPHALPEPWTLPVLGVIILWKEFSYRRIWKKGRESGSVSLKADAWHHRSDALTSLAAFVGISLALILGKGYESADDWAALAASGFILYNSYRIFRPALGEIMDEHMYDELIESIRKSALEVDGVRETEKCLVRKTGLKYHIELHALVDEHLTVREGHTIAHLLKDHLTQNIPQLGHVLIHIEPFEKKSPQDHEKEMSGS